MPPDEPTDPARPSKPGRGRDVPLDDRLPGGTHARRDTGLARRAKPQSGPVEDEANVYRPEPGDEGPSPDDLARFGDVTIECPKCGTRLMDDVAICWKCGHALADPLERRRTPIATIVIVALAVIALLWLTIF